MIWLLLILLAHADGQPNVRWTSTQSLSICADNKDIRAYFEFPVHPQNQYTLNVTTEIQPFSSMILRFDSEVSLKLIEPTNARISKFPGANEQSYQFRVMFTEKTSHLFIKVLGPTPGSSLPYVLSVILNDLELCDEPRVGYFNDLFENTQLIREGRAAETSPIGESCGRRKVAHTELIVLGQPTQPGDWPWHVAIKSIKGLSFSYICGGTLLSKTLVLTAAHCVTTKDDTTEYLLVESDSLIIELGKYNLRGGDIARQDIGVSEVIVHPEFAIKTLNNDIAVLKLKSEADFDDYVQPACLQHTELPTDEVFGTGSVAKCKKWNPYKFGTKDVCSPEQVVGWGLNEHGEQSSTLQQINIPIVSEMTCLTSDPKFFQKRLNTNRFCAGYGNGTSACHGDSGGGFMVFVPDTTGDAGKASGTWYVRGIVSFGRTIYYGDDDTVGVCDTYRYTVFTDVEKYRDWVIKNL